MSNYINPGKLFRHLDRLNALQAGRIQAPVNVEFDLSNRCSLGCSYCHFAYTHTRGPNVGKQDKPGGAPGGDLMDGLLAANIVRELEACGVRSITWTGGGEPTLNPHFSRIVESVLIDQGVYTNGTNLTPENIKAIKECCKWVYVSLDAASNESYQTSKGVDKFGAVCRGILDLVQAPGAATVGMGYLVTRENWKDIIKAWELSQSLGVDYIQYRPVILFDPANPGQLAEDTGWIDNAMDMLENVSRLPGVVVDLDRFRIYRDWHGHGYKTCYWSGLQATITPNGKVWTCVNKREYPGAEIGDLTRDSFVDVWKRRKIVEVGKDCRLSCRGHPANLVLNELLKPNEHGSFI